MFNVSVVTHCGLFVFPSLKKSPDKKKFFDHFLLGVIVQKNWKSAKPSNIVNSTHNHKEYRRNYIHKTHSTNGSIRFIFKRKQKQQNNQKKQTIKSSKK